MATQLDLSEKTSNWTNVSSSKKRLQRLHHSRGMSIFEISYKYDVPVEKVKDAMREHDIHISPPIDWKEDRSVLQKVAMDGEERRFTELLSKRITINHVKNCVENYNIKEYDIDHRDPDQLRDAIERYDTKEEVADHFKITVATLDTVISDELGAKPEKVMEEGADSVTTADIPVDINSVIENAATGVDVYADGTAIVAEVSFEVDGMLQIDESKTVELLDITSLFG